MGRSRDSRIWKRTSSDLAASNAGDWICVGYLLARRPASIRYRCPVSPLSRSFSRLQVPLCHLGHRSTGDEASGCHVPEPRCGPCSSTFCGNLHVTTRGFAPGHRYHPSASFHRDYADLCQSGRDCVAADRSTLAGGAAMLAQAVESYLTVRRACGFALKSQGNLLRSFAAFSDARGKSHVCQETAIEWAGLALSLIHI